MTQGELNQLASRFQIVSEKVRREAAKYLWWGKLKGNINVEGSISLRNNDLQVTPSEMPIEANFNALQIPGMGNTMVIPTRREYTGTPKFGDAVAKGFEEDAGYTWTNVHYNQIRHPVTVQKGQQDRLQEEILRAAEQSVPMLGRFFAKWENWNATAAVYEGLSENLSAAAGDGGLALPKRYNPNFFHVVAGTSIPVRHSTHAVGTYPTTAEITAMAQAVDNTDGSTVSTLSCAILENLAATCRDNNIEPIITMNGDKYWLLIVHSKQMAALRADTTWLPVQRDAWSGSGYRDNPIFTGAAGAYAGFVIFQDDIIVRSWDLTNNDFLGQNKLDNGAYDYAEKNRKYNRRFMPFYTSSTSDGHSNYCAIVLGKSALGYVEKQSLHYAYDDDDYQNLKGLAGIQNYGYSRLDQVSQSELAYLTTTPASITSVYNDGSLILMTGAVH